MSVLQIALVYGAIPGGFVALVALLIFVPSAARAQRYRPGRPWPHDPVWYIPHPQPDGPVPAGGRPAGAHPRELSARLGGPPASVLDDVATAKGGAHGSW